MWTYNYSYELYHHGVKGMKWGVRRFQKEDGTLTPAGKKRYSEDVVRAKSELKTAKASQKTAQKAYNKASNKASIVPTKKNRQALNDASKNLIQENRKVNASQLNYDIAKYDAKGGFSGKKSKHRTMLEDTYRNLGYTPKEAEVLADKRIKTEKIVVGCAAVAVTACAVYATNRYIRNRSDQILAAGTSFQRIEMADTEGKLNDMFYVSTGKHDNARYEGMLGAVRKTQTGKAYMMKLEATGDIKVASKEKAVSVFKDLYENDSDFRSKAKDFASSHFTGKNEIDFYDKMSGKEIKFTDKQYRKMYENFNSNLVTAREKGNGVDKTFYNKLKEAGYHAIQDINDMDYSGYNAKNPLIVFDNSNSRIMVQSVKELTDTKNLNKRKNIEVGKALAEQLAKEYTTNPSTVIAISGLAAGGLAMDKVNYSLSKNVASKNSQVQLYKEMHPGTKLTDKEIEEMLKKKG